MNIDDAVTIILAYQDEGKLSGSKRRLLMTARKVIWDRAETIRRNAEE